MIISCGRVDKFSCLSQLLCRQMSNMCQSERESSFLSSRGQLLQFISEEKHGLLDKINNRLRTKKIFQPDVQKNSMRQLTIHEVCSAIDSDQWKLVPIGSCASALATTSSDVDMVLLPLPKNMNIETFNRKFADVKYRRSMMTYVMRKGNTKRVIEKGSFQFIPKAFAPICHFRHRSIDIDIQFGSIGAIHSTNFVRSCVQLDDRVFPLIHWCFSQFDSFHLRNPKQGLFSSYHITMIVLFFLQQEFCSSVILPHMYKCVPHLNEKRGWLKVAGDLKDRHTISLMDSSFQSSDESPAETIIRMIDYYSTLDLEEKGIDLGKNRLFPIDEDSSGLLILHSPYFPHLNTTCRVNNAPSLIHQLFTSLRQSVENGKIV